MRTQETELLDVAVTVLVKARETEVDSIKCTQDAMLNLRIDWESLQSCLYNRKIDGFEPAVEAIKRLAATGLAVAATLQAKILNQRALQMARETEELNTGEEISRYKEERSKPKKKRGRKKGSKNKVAKARAV